MSPPHTDAGALLRLRTDLAQRARSYWARGNAIFNGFIIAQELTHWVEAIDALRQAASQCSAGGEANLSADEMRRTAAELRATPGGGCDVIRQAIMWECKAAALSPPVSKTGCGDPSCRDPNCTYVQGPIPESISGPVSKTGGEAEARSEVQSGDAAELAERLAAMPAAEAVRGPKDWATIMFALRGAAQASRHTGTYLGYRNDAGEEMHCANVFCPHPDKCLKGCANRKAVAVPSADGGTAA